MSTSYPLCATWVRAAQRAWDTRPTPSGTPPGDGAVALCALPGELQCLGWVQAGQGCTPVGCRRSGGGLLDVLQVPPLARAAHCAGGDACPPLSKGWPGSMGQRWPHSPSACQSQQNAGSGSRHGPRRTQSRSLTHRLARTSS